MFPNATRSAVAHSLLTEVASSTSFQNAILWVYGALGVFAVVCLVAGYFVARAVDTTEREFRSPT
jgi:ABC-type multidrug transport system permease subunit